MAEDNIPKQMSQSKHGVLSMDSSDDSSFKFSDPERKWNLERA